MQYRMLGRTGIKVSPYCLGAMMSCWPPKRATGTSGAIAPLVHFSPEKS